ncbi:unnamed protein product [Penicillium salamii]|uniref:DUF1688-domain-containing protein n=1 Tax=Penicillium salamii TaxID=1612424 RepID=A0A9W4JQG0_9EURO|nr:unnamed protein product [Penicillium salamii]CAG8257958.1 unnamed protein product [Penicillium salamii]CAG8375278.1 unnamed protein product [Penicillium salamii]CAG8399377.1 unnamed protein product [Penicillium salamii]CAG8405458.1 unnamed protein product [Penicillium salamii]
MNPQIEELLGLEAVRSRAHAVLKLAEQGRLNHFNYHADRMEDATDYVLKLIQRDFGPDKYHLIPPHGRWQHFEVGGVPRIDNLLTEWDQQNLDTLEKTRRLVDLFFVSVLLDAGAGDFWRFQEPGTGHTLNRSEGIAVAALHMFLNGDFAGPDSPSKHTANGEALRNINIEILSRGLQVNTENNPMVGVGARTEIIRKLGESLVNLKEVFGPTGRPGNLVDYLIAQSKESGKLDYKDLWNVLQRLLLPIWPSDRTHVEGYPIGDAWPLRVLEQAPGADSRPYPNIQPFHKLTQWLAYSLQVPFSRLLSVSWTNTHLGTGLPEYRNGGMLVDMGVLELKPEALQRGLTLSGGALPSFGAGDDEIVEWRAMTVALLDEMHAKILKRLDGVELSLPQVLEAGSWKAGRELAAAKRPDTKCSPILNFGDGTLF